MSMSPLPAIDLEGRVCFENQKGFYYFKKNLEQRFQRLKPLLTWTSSMMLVPRANIFVTPFTSFFNSILMKG